jgi:hypothetical protein
LLLLLRLERAAAATPVCVLHVPRLLLLGPRVLLLRLLGKHVCGVRLACMRERGWEHNAHTRVDPGCMLHRVDQSLVVQGVWFYVRWVLARSDALHMRMHFDQRVLDHLGTDCLLCACLTIGVGPHDRGACSACVPTSQSVWGAAPAAKYETR